MSAITVGISDTDGLAAPAPERRRLLAEIAAAGLDHLTVGDHISFHDGTGFDGMTAASALLAAQDRLPVLIGVYLLGLRHPMLAARQLSTLSQLAPGRLILGVGVAGEDRREIANAGVDPATRGRRLDETLAVLRRLLAGEEVSHAGEFFQLDQARILPVPDPPVPVVIGGRGAPAIRRAALLGDGWLGMFCSARRFAATREAIGAAAAAAGREPPGWYGLNVWCGLDPDPGQARALLAAKMERLYRLPYERFQHLAPAGTPEQVAGFLAPYAAAGARHFTLIPAGASVQASVEGVAQVRRLLAGG